MKAVLSAMKAGGPYTVEVTGSSIVRYEDVMVGEVWLCSGQSNMEMGVGAALNAKEEIAAANYPNIRLLLVAKKWAPEPQNDIDGVWKVCSPQSIAEGGWGGFSAAAYYFGRELHKKLGVAVGLVDSSWGGTRIEPWHAAGRVCGRACVATGVQLVQLGDPRTPLHQQRLDQALKETERWLAGARQALDQRTIVPPMPAFPAELQPPHDVQNATALYNGMVYPVRPFSMRGAIWVQGESNLATESSTPRK